MKLHLPDNQEAFKQLINIASNHLKIEEIYIEKDYFVVLALKGLAESEYRDNGIFKGGTSLSKAFGVIHRFSEDIDMAVVNDEGTGTGNRGKMQKVEKALTSNEIFTEDSSHERAKKRSRLRQTVHNYPILDAIEDFGQISKHLFIDVSTISPGLPFEERQISTYIHDFLIQTGQHDAIQEFELSPISVNTLSIERTFAEKFGTAVKLSSQADHDGTLPMDRLKKGVRHIYDLHQLLKEERIISFVSGKTKFAGQDFNEFMARVLTDDLNGMQDEEGYNQYMNCNFSECLLYGNIENTWKELNATFIGSFNRLLFNFPTAPTSEEIVTSLQRLKMICEDFDNWKKEHGITF